MKVNQIETNNTNMTAPTQAAMLKYGLGVYASPRVQQDNFQLSMAPTVKKNAIKAAFENFLLKHNQNALLERYMTPEAVKKMLNAAPVVSSILKEKGVNAEACVENLRKIKDTHVGTTVEYANAIANELNLSKEDKKAVHLGSLFHDFGKIMMPDEILNKQGQLDSRERAIIDTHSRIGYELLKRTGMDAQALSIVRNHHRAASMTKDFLPKVVSAADVYSALTEKRCYKEPMTSAQAFEVMDSFVETGKLDETCVNALKKYIGEQERKAA